MPYEWLPPTPDSQARLHLWPYRSLPRRGFVLFIGATCALIAVPMLAVLAEIVEDLTLDRDSLALTRHGPRGARQDWQANPYWVTVHLHPTGGPVPNYLTLKGNGREVELGAFLSEDERLTLCDELQTRLAALR